MPSSSDRVAAPLYLELAPPSGAGAEVDHLFVFRDSGVLSGRGSGRFATDLFTLSMTSRADDDGAAAVSLAPPRPAFVPRSAPFRGVVAGLRLSSRPQRLPPAEPTGALSSALARVRLGDDALPALVAALDALARELTFAAPGQAFSERTLRRRARADTGVSRRRLAAMRRFRHLLGQLARQTLPLTDLALEAGYYDQAHMTAACRAFAGRPAGALRLQAAPRDFGPSLQDAWLGDRLRLVIMDEGKESRHGAIRAEEPRF